MSTFDEFELIRMLTRGRQTPEFLKQSGVVTGIGDDAAVVQVDAAAHWIVTCDTMTEDIHFKRITMRDEDIGFKAMASAVSDIAAMGGIPRFAVIALSLPGQTDIDRVRAMYAGMYDCADRYRVAVIGGDTTSSAGGITVSVTVIGETPAGKALLRSAARPGHIVFATGHLGRSAAGLEWLLEHNQPSDRWEDGFAWMPYPSLAEAHCRPLPQIEAGEVLRLSGSCGALNDISDGLASEAWEICEASQIGIDLIEDQIPIDGQLLTYAGTKNKDPLDYVFYGGEDYQLVGTAPAEKAAQLQQRLKEAGVDMHVIGTVNTGHREVRLVRRGGDVMPLAKKGYNHFSSGRGGVK